MEEGGEPLLKVRAGDPVNGILGSIDHRLERRDHLLPYQCFCWAEAYEEGRLEVRFPVEGLHRSMSPKYDDEIPERGHLSDASGNAGRLFRTNKHTQLLKGELNTVTDKDYEMVLVAFVHRLDGMEIFIPVRIGLERVYLVDDVFGGDVHLSGINGACKILRPANKWETNFAAIWSLRARYRVADEVECGSQIVDRIADDQGEVIGDGWLCLDVNQTVCGLAALPDSKLEWVVRKIFGDLPVKVSDMLLGPIDLRERVAK